jgi:hypothetical protein
MRKTAIMLSAAALLAGPSTQAQDMGFALMDVARQSTMYMELKMMSRQNGKVTFWILEVRPKGAKPDYAMIQHTIDCAKAHMTTIQTREYVMGEPASASRQGGAAGPVTPGTVSQTLFNFVCKKQDPFPKIYPVTSIPAAVEQARGMMADIFKK